MVRRLLFLSPVVIFAVIAGYFFWGLNPERQVNFIPSTMIDKPTPDFDLPPVAGLSQPGFASADLKTGGVLLVNFFASWCVPCKAEHPVLTKLAAQEEVPLYGINYKDEPDSAQTWLAELGNPYERIGADEGRAAIEWGVYGVPETFVIDGEGRIQYHHRGPLLDERVINEITGLIRALKS